MLPMPFNVGKFASKKSIHKERLFNLHKIAQAWYQATYSGNSHGRTVNSIMSHKQYHPDFVPLDKHYEDQ